MEAGVTMDVGDIVRAAWHVMHGVQDERQYGPRPAAPYWGWYVHPATYEEMILANWHARDTYLRYGTGGDSALMATAFDSGPASRDITLFGMTVTPDPMVEQGDLELRYRQRVTLPGATVPADSPAAALPYTGDKRSHP